MKLVSNLLLITGVTALAEAIATARGQGVTDDLLRTVFGNSGVLSPASRMRLDDRGARRREPAAASGSAQASGSRRRPAPTPRPMPPGQRPIRVGYLSRLELTDVEEITEFPAGLAHADPTPTSMRRSPSCQPDSRIARFFCPTAAEKSHWSCVALLGALGGERRRSGRCRATST
jgi:hypothetical protein